MRSKAEKGIMKKSRNNNPEDKIERGMDRK